MTDSRGPAASDMTKVTRVELIDHRYGSPSFGRVFVAWDVSAELSLQDDGRTLKVFVRRPHGT